MTVEETTKMRVKEVLNYITNMLKKHNAIYPK